MTAFDALHPAVQHHIVNTLGWSSLRPLQERAIGPILRGEHAILLAPTAGGKTEAALFPVLSRAISEDWRGLGVLYLCPIKALLNNLEPRLSHFAGLVGRRVGVWHGDIGASARRGLAKQPPDILLTTPESLEAMLVSRLLDHRLLFANLRTVVVDELHAFAGDDRGWHLLYLLQRLTRLAGGELQRLGLSATVGNPESLRDWLTHDCGRPGSVIDPEATTREPAHASMPDLDVTLDWVGSLDNAATVISRLHRGEKRLVFCDSRARVEQLALALREREVRTYVSHSCLSLEARRAAEEAFAQGSDCVIVATSTLELGIDVGDLDRVIQIDAPSTVAAFLQRIGRTGRRSGSLRNCLFLITREDAFLQAVALLRLWREGYVEPVTPPPFPLHIFAQQIMALALQEGGISLGDWPRWLGTPPGLADADARDLDAVVDYMVERGMLHSDGGILWIGEEGERRFGYRHFLDLLSVFASPPLVQVLYGRQELGEVHQSSFMLKEGRPAVLSLAGRAWRTKTVDWARRRAYVEPTDEQGRSRWLSAAQPLHYALCRAMLAVLTQDEPPVRFSQRALAFMRELRLAFDWAEPGKSFLVDDQTGGIRWWTFAGKLANVGLAQALQEVAPSSKCDNLAIHFEGRLDIATLRSAVVERAFGALGNVTVPLDQQFIAELKFSACLPPEHRESVLARRYSLTRDLRDLATHPVAAIHDVGP